MTNKNPFQHTGWHSVHTLSLIFQLFLSSSPFQENCSIMSYTRQLATVDGYRNWKTSKRTHST